jgi:hypothetical protein
MQAIYWIKNACSGENDMHNHTINNETGAG